MDLGRYSIFICKALLKDICSELKLKIRISLDVLPLLPHILQHSKYRYSEGSSFTATLVELMFVNLSCQTSHALLT